MRKKYFLLIISFFLVSCLFYSERNSKNKLRDSFDQIHKLEASVSSECDRTEIAARQSSIHSQSFLVIWIVTLISIFSGKYYIWKVVLPVFWGCKYRIQSPRCKLTNEHMFGIIFTSLPKFVLSMGDWIWIWIIKKKL